MGQFASFDESFSLEEQIKSLGNEELLDFWEETQQLTRLMASTSAPIELPLSAKPSLDEQSSFPQHPEYERLILQELQVRLGRGALR